MSIGVSESLLSSIAPRALASALKQVPELRLELHAHRSPVIVEHVRSGRYALGLCAEAAVTKDLNSTPIAREPMVLIPSGLKSFRWPKEVPILTIESSSATWSGLSRQLATFERVSGVRLIVSQTLESFTALAQMARAGFGHALVPLGVAESLGLKKHAMPLPKPGLSRQISLIGRRSVLSQARVVRASAVLRIELALTSRQT